jgi:hypothetical protein
MPRKSGVYGLHWSSSSAKGNVRIAGQRLAVRPAEVNSVERTALEMVSLLSRLNWMIPTSKNIKH